MKPIIETIQKQMTMSFEENVVKTVREVGIIVDKERLEKALYDAKSFYEEGYKDGAAANPPVVHGEWIPTTKHKWKTDKNGDVSEWAWDHEYHNGPVCEICGARPCVHCKPGWQDDEGCDEHFICSECGRHEEEQHPYCHCGAKMDGGVHRG